MPVDPPVVALRRAALRQWIATHYGGKQAAFIGATSINQGELSALLKGGKSFGEKKAAIIEMKAKMPEGYLVRPTTTAAVSPPAPDQAPTRPGPGAAWVGQKWGGPVPLKESQGDLWKQILLHLDRLPEQVCDDLAGLIIQIANSESELSEVKIALKKARARAKANS